MSGSTAEKATGRVLTWLQTTPVGREDYSRWVESTTGLPDCNGELSPQESSPPSPAAPPHADPTETSLAGSPAKESTSASTQEPTEEPTPQPTETPPLQPTEEPKPTLRLTEQPTPQSTTNSTSPPNTEPTPQPTDAFSPPTTNAEVASAGSFTSPAPPVGPDKSAPIVVVNITPSASAACLTATPAAFFIALALARVV